MGQSSMTFGPRPCSAGNISNLVRPDGMKIPLHRELISLSSMLIDVTEARGHNLPAYGTWGAYCRRIDGTNEWSDHAPGCAIDFDAPNNPYASAAWHRRNGNAVIFGKRVRCSHPQWMFELWEAHGFYAGVRYDSKPDPMHLSFVRSLSECRAITYRLRMHLKHPTGALPKPAAPKPKPPRHIGDDMFTYEHGEGAAFRLVLVAGGKQVNLSGNEILANARAMDTHLGPVGADEVVRFTKAYGAVIS